MSQQITFASIIAENNKPKPLFSVGDLVYCLIYDEIREVKITEHFEFKDKDGTFREHRYWGDTTNKNYHECFGENDLGKEVFKNYDEAKKKAQKNSALNPCVDFSKKNIVKQIVELDKNENWKHEHWHRFILLFDDNTVAYKDTVCYSFAKSFDNERDALKFFEYIKKKFKITGKSTSIDYKFKPANIDVILPEELQLYYCCDSEKFDVNNYASREYFYNHYFKPMY